MLIGENPKMGGQQSQRIFKKNFLPIIGLAQTPQVKSGELLWQQAVAMAAIPFYASMFFCQFKQMENIVPDIAENWGKILCEEWQEEVLPIVHLFSHFIFHP